MPLPALAAALLAGCSSTADTPVPPEGFTRIEQGWIGVHVPEGLVDKPDKRAGKFDIVLENDVEKPTLQLVIASDYSEDGPGAHAAMSMLRSTRPVSNVDDNGQGGLFTEVRSDEGRDVWKWPFTYDDGEYQGVAWTADDGKDDERVVAVILTGKDLDEKVVKEIEDSLEVLPEAVEAEKAEG
ncbi:MAG TPA: hypothetical protein VFX33_07885 [Actinomycetales bacterium]|nr:hypothetical protein [Actinomycetales bacterium]